MAAPAFAHSTGPRSAKIALVGEAWGRDEELVKLPFMGQSGQELTRILQDAEIARSECFLTNVFAFRPSNNDISTLCVKKGELPSNYTLKPIQLGKYLKPEFLPEIERLREELSIIRPNIVVALGNVACWALLGSAGIGALRGSTAESSILPGQKVLPTYHPAAVLRNWAYRPIVVADLLKAKREANFPEIVRPKRRVLIEPTLQELEEWVSIHKNSLSLAVDVETTRGQIDMIGFAAGASEALVVPFFTNEAPWTNFWASSQDEARARVLVQELLLSEGEKIMQNGLYDIQYLLREGYVLHNCSHDTMLRHHALYPELQKGLGFLGSIYSSESSWKLLNRNKGEALKRDD
jgi:uracil-DNA glycosylase